MAISLRIRGLLVLAGAVFLVIWAQWYTSGLLKGVIVSGAGIDDAVSQAETFRRRSCVCSREDQLGSKKQVGATVLQIVTK